MSILQPAGGTGSGFIVSAEGVNGARLSHVTLNGNSSASGLRVTGGSKGVRVNRNIVRNTARGLVLDGAGTQVEVFNNTLVANGTGIQATNCADLDVRNSIFALNTTGLQYSTTSCPLSQRILLRYNDYFNNGAGLLANGISQAASGPGEIAKDPEFTNPAVYDYRPFSDSPVIDAGDPDDPTPPGTGGRVDMGYIESGRVAIYADHRYCSQCDNDGLTWLVDAFDTVQSALDAARTLLGQLNNAEPTDLRCTIYDPACVPAGPVRISVGVGDGTYTEHVTVTSHISLLGSGPEYTTLDGGGSGSVVTLDGVTDAEVRGFRITGAGASEAGLRAINAANVVSVTRNLFTGNPQGMLFASGASGSVEFNTLTGNSGTNIRSQDATTQVSVRNTLLNGGAVGLSRATGGAFSEDYNLFYNHATADAYDEGTASSFALGMHDLAGQNPQLVGVNAYPALNPTSPAIDAAHPGAAVPTGGGVRADIGYHEVLAVPLALLFGQLGNSCALASSGGQQPISAHPRCQRRRTSLPTGRAL